jgi:hypothetical protein
MAAARLVGPRAALLVLLCGCATPLPERHDGAGRDPDGATEGASLRFEPPAPLDAITPITRIVVDFSHPIDEPRVLLIAGTLTSSQVRDLGRPVLPQTITDRAVSAIAWTDRASGAGAHVVVAPLVTLERGALYTVGVSAPAGALPFTVESTDSDITLPRVWPDHDDPSVSARAAVWCGSRDIALADTPLVLDPAGVVGRFSSGTGGPVVAKRCVSWFARDEPPAGIDGGGAPAVAPASLSLADGSRVLLEPTLLWSGAAPSGADPVSCGDAQVTFGPGCAEVEDDRVVVTPPGSPILWTIDTGVATVVRATRDAKRFVVRPIPPGGTFRATTLDRSGSVTYREIGVAPAPPRSHLVINEVMANPLGDEPAQEWVEIYNDGSSPSSLGGVTLEDVGGRTVLPDVSLAAGAFALVVSEGFVENDGVDPVPVEGTAIVRVPALGKSGLSNDGEPLVLRGPNGEVVSTFPAIKTKSGVSVARVTPDAVDDDPTSFEMSANGSGTPGAPNVP